MWPLQMHCNLRPTEPCQSSPCQVWSRWTYQLPYYSVFAADTLLYTVTFTFEPVTLTFDLWTWTFMVYRLWPDETLYLIWAKSSNPHRSYCNFSIWPNDLERCVTCCARVLDNYHKVWHSTTYPCWIIAFLCWYVVSHCDIEILCVMCLNFIQNLCKENIPWLNYWRFSTFSPCDFRGRAQLTRGVSGVHWPNFTKLGEDLGRSSQHCTFLSELGYLAAFSNVGDAKFCTFWPTVKIMVSEISIPVVETLTTTEPPENIWRQSSVQLLSDVYGQKKKENQRKKVHG